MDVIEYIIWMKVATVQKPSKNFAKTEREQVESLTSAEMEQHVTAVCCRNSAGNLMSSALIFLII